MSPKMKSKICEVWSEAFEKLQKLEKHEIHQNFKPFEMVGLYAVASICYDDGNFKPRISDNVYDHLCDSILEYFDECVGAGADMLDRHLLRCHSGYDMRIFIQPYHDIASVLLGHPCNCFKCKNVSLENHDSAE